MNYKKGFFRITIVLSSISVLLGLIIGINQFQFSKVYKVYNSKLNSHNFYQKDMLDLLNNNKIKILGFADEIFKDSIVVESAAEKFKIKRDLIKNIYLDSLNNVEYISIKEIIDSGLNKKMNAEMKSKIASEYANANVDISSFPWKEFLFYVLLFPLILGGIIWLIYYIAKYIVIGFQT